MSENGKRGVEGEAHSPHTPREKCAFCGSKLEAESYLFCPNCVVYFQHIPQFPHDRPSGTVILCQICKKPVSALSSERFEHYGHAYSGWFGYGENIVIHATCESMVFKPHTRKFDDYFERTGYFGLTKAGRREYDRIADESTKLQTALLKTVLLYRRGLSVRKMSAETGLPQTTTHRIIAKVRMLEGVPEQK